MRRRPGNTASENQPRLEPARSTTAGWFATAMLLVIFAGLGLRYGTNILDQSNVRDEYLMKVPIDDIVEKGWSFDTTLNYQEVKGPTFFWSYALAAQVIGNEINDLRMITVLFLIGGAVPLLMIMVRCGVRGPWLVVGAMLYMLLPYNALVGQMLMSEPSFVFFAMWLMWTFLWGFGDNIQTERRVCGPVLFAVMLLILLHHRPHAVAFAGAATLISWERDGIRSWPWWLACFAAGLSRLPLWVHWGGLVTSDYQSVFTLGFRLEPATYLIAAALPLTWLFLWRGLLDPVNAARRWWVYIGGAVGCTLGLFFRPDVNLMSPPYVLPGYTEPTQQQMFAGIVTTTLRTLVPTGAAHTLAIITLATVGGAAIGAMLAMTWGRSMINDARGVVMRASFWTLLVGIGLFTLTGGPVYDRYLQIWAILLPAIWLWSAPRWLLIVHGLLLTAIAARLLTEWLL